MASAAKWSETATHLSYPGNAFDPEGIDRHRRCRRLLPYHRPGKIFENIRVVRCGGIADIKFPWRHIETDDPRIEIVVFVRLHRDVLADAHLYISILIMTYFYQ